MQQNDDDVSSVSLKLELQFKEIEQFVSQLVKRKFYSAMNNRDYAEASIALKQAMKEYKNLKELADMENHIDNINFFTKNFRNNPVRNSVSDEEFQKRQARLNNLKSEINNLKSKITGLENKNKELTEENENLLNKTKAVAIEEKVPGYVKKATSSLSEDVIGFTCSAVIWAGAGMVFIIMAITAVLFTYLNTPDYKSLSSLQIVYLFTRGLIGVGILCWAAQYCLSMTKSFTHEIVRRKDTIHSIRFGELFLEIFGSSVTKNEAMEAFKNWNNAGNTAFNEPVENAPVMKLKEYGNDLSEVAKNLADLAAKLTPEKK